MKKICSILLVAASAMALFSCQKQETISPEVSSEEFVLTFTSEKPAFDDETKTEWTGETIQWSKGDKISVAYTVNGNWQNASGNASGDAKLYKSDALTEASEVAQFNVSASFKGTTEGTHVFYGVYPAPSETAFSNAPVAALTVASVQNAKAETFDSTGDLMVGVSREYDSRPGKDETISLIWERLVAHAVVTLKDINGFTAGEKLEYITLTAQADANLVGQQKINLIDGTVVKDNNTANVLKLAADKLTVTNGNVTFWACFLPETITSLTVEVETDKATYTREITGISKEFKKNARNILAVNMTEAVRVVKPVDNNVTDVLTRAITGVLGTNYTSWSDIQCTSDAVYAGQSAGDNESIQLRSNNNNSGVITTASGGYARKIVVQWNSYTSSGRTLNVYGNTTAYTTPADLYASETQGTLLGTIVCGTSTDLTIEGDYEYIGMRSASGAMYLEEIKISWAPNTTPSIKLAETIEVSAEECEGTIEVKYANIDDVVALLKFYADDTYSEIASYNWLTAEIDENNNVHYLVDANESLESRTAYIAVFVGEIYKHFTITQEGKPAEGGSAEEGEYFVKVTSAPADWSGTYLIVYEEGAVAFDGSRATMDDVGNTKAVTISNNEIEATDAMKAITFEIAKSGSNYIVKSKSGYYVGQSSNANGLKSNKSTSYNHTLSMSGTDVNMVSGEAYLRYNSANDQTRFRYYKSSSYTYQEAIQLYKLVDWSQSGGGVGGDEPAEDGGTTDGGGSAGSGGNSSESNQTPAVNQSWLELPTGLDGSQYVVTTLTASGERNYTHLYDKDNYLSLWTAYPLKSSHMGTLSRPGSWSYNPNIDSSDQADLRSNSYSGDTYSRGHMIPNSSRNGISEMQKQTFHVTNSVPQRQNKFNGSIWNALEQAVQSVAKSEEIFVVTGVALNKVGENKTISYVTPSKTSQKCAIPNYFYKVVLKVNYSGNTVTSASTIGFWFEHKDYDDTDYSKYSVSVDQIEQWTGFDFFVNLPDGVETTAEKNTSWSTFQNF